MFKHSKNKAIIISSIFCFAFMPLKGEEAKEIAPRMDSIPKDQFIGKESYGLYFFKKKVGWFLTESCEASYKNQPAIKSSEQIVFKVILFGEEVSMKSESTTYYSLKDKGEILHFQSKEIEENEVTTIKANLEGDSFIVTKKSATEEITKTIKKPKDNLLNQFDFSKWLESPRKIGDSFTVYEFSFSDLFSKPQETKETLVYLYNGKKDTRISGVETTVLTLTLDQEDFFKPKMEILPNGEILKGRMGPLIIKREDEKTAKQLIPATVNQINIGKDLGKPKNLKFLRLELSGLEIEKFPTNHRQKIEKSESGKLHLILNKENKSKKIILSTQDRSRFTESNSKYQSDKKEILELAKKITIKSSSPKKSAKMIVKWLFKNIEPSYHSNAETASAVLKSRKGDCTEYALLFVSLARALKIPAREVSGLMYDSSPQPAFYLHQWAEFHNGKRWVSVDPAWNQIQVDAGHIYLSTGKDPDIEAMNVLNELQFKVVGFDTKDREPTKKKRQ